MGGFDLPTVAPYLSCEVPAESDPPAAATARPSRLPRSVLAHLRRLGFVRPAAADRRADAAVKRVAKAGGGFRLVLDCTLYNERWATWRAARPPLRLPTPADLAAAAALLPPQQRWAVVGDVRHAFHLLQLPADTPGPAFLLRGELWEWRAAPMGAVYSSQALAGTLTRVLALPAPPPLPPRPLHGPGLARPVTAAPPFAYADDIADAGALARVLAFRRRVAPLLPWKRLDPPAATVDYLGVRVALQCSPTPTLSVAHRLPPMPRALRCGGWMPAADLAGLVGWIAWASHAVHAPAPPPALLAAGMRASRAPRGARVWAGDGLVDAARVCWADLSKAWHLPPRSPLPGCLTVHCDAAVEGDWRRAAVVGPDWYLTRDYEDGHITTLEARAMCLAAVRAPRDVPLRIVTDSAAAALAACRGRARGAASTELGAAIAALRGAVARRRFPTAVAWVPSRFNAADKPSRGSPPDAEEQLVCGRFVGYVPFAALGPPC